SQRAWMLKNVQESYEDFVAQVAHGRNMTPDAVDAVGGGRVWTGEQALEHGLVDSLGDLRHALDTLRQLAQVESCSSSRRCN
ncbi:signal peptide peptidase SppA, partial [bacterium]|nr:signal peptide peptidase SppA [bacterium]